MFREINFTSVEPMEKFRLEQKVLFKVDTLLRLPIYFHQSFSHSIFLSLYVCCSSEMELKPHYIDRVAVWRSGILILGKLLIIFVLLIAMYTTFQLCHPQLNQHMAKSDRSCP